MKRLLVSAILVLAFAVAMTASAVTSITVQWDDNETTEAGYRIERKEGSSGAYAFLVDTAADATSYVDGAAVDGVRYCYRLRAFNATSISAWTSDVCMLVAPTNQKIITITVTP